MGKIDHALSDVKILDLTRAVAGPTCTRMLVEMGAEVIKIEPAPNGDMIRPVSVFKDDRSLFFVQQNRGKQSVCINLKDPRGIALVAELVAQVDVVVENFRPGVMDALGLNYESLRELKDDIILCSISTFGQSGPLSQTPGYDFIAQAYSGITSMIGEPDEPPCLPGTAIGDASTGVHGALGVLAAIHHRNRTGEGDHLDVALVDVYYSYHESNVHVYSGSEGKVSPTRQGSHFTYLCPCGVFRGSGGFIVIMAFLHHWPDFCRAINREDLSKDPSLADEPSRLARREELTEIIEAWLATFPDIQSAVDHLASFDVPCAPILSVADTFDNPHLRERGTVRTIVDPIHGPVDIPGHPIKWSRLPNNIPLDAPTLGQHNEAVLAEMLGCSDKEIHDLANDGVLFSRNS
ncbi:MAG: CoA transferase [Gammaproteobacteria bacterium]